MHEELTARGWTFEVWFMADSEPNRCWTFADSDFSFPHRFLSGVHPTLGSQSLHISLEVLTRLHQHRPDILLVAGSWTIPTVWFASLSSTPSRKIFWSESHLSSSQHRGSLVGWARRLILRRFCEFAVPGTFSKNYVTHHTRKARIYDLPNFVDPIMSCGDSEVTRQLPRPSFKSGQDRRTLLIVARLAPEKGLLPFFEGLRQLGPNDRRRLTVLIAGSGPMRDELRRRIDTSDLDVHLVGHKSQREMSELYAQADGFCLPSLSDPNPLSVIEALWAGLPLLLSSRVGNHPECLQPSKNGFLFDPLNPQSLADVMSRWLDLSDEQLANFGEASSRIAHEEFVPHQIVQKFLNQVLTPPTLEAGCSTQEQHFADAPESITHSSSRP
jgi:glycosyltransferase involved in cell wall biosynthesis